MFRMVEQAGIGAYLMPGSPLDFSEVERLPAQPAPKLGQHTDEILHQILGLSQQEIDKLHDRKVIA
jgi:2-methylfumaryl-CoA isomerase